MPEPPLASVHRPSPPRGSPLTRRPNSRSFVCFFFSFGARRGSDFRSSGFAAISRAAHSYGKLGRIRTRTCKRGWSSALDHDHENRTNRRVASSRYLNRGARLRHSHSRPFSVLSIYLHLHVRVSCIAAQTYASTRICSNSLSRCDATRRGFLAFYRHSHGVPRFESYRRARMRTISEKERKDAIRRRSFERRDATYLRYLRTIRVIILASRSLTLREIRIRVR